MKIKLSSVFVDDQAKALKFYTEVLGFVKKTDVAAGEFRWLTVVSPEGPDDMELVLEPNNNPAARTYQQAIFEQGIPITSFSVDNVRQEYDRLKKLGVEFRTEPTTMDWGTFAIFDDTCGNLIQLHQV
ncbi:MAG TPA: VOC family protein [Herpetosiphonaceae bacterium]